MPRLSTGLVFTLLGCLPPAAAQTAILQLQVTEGENAVHPAGSRSLRPLTVQVTDETGRPISNVAVSFRLPESESTGAFANGLKTDLKTSGPDGKVSASPIQWTAAPGPTRIQITAAKDQARAGTVVSQYLAAIETVKTNPSPAVATTRLREAPKSPQVKSGGKHRWVWAVAGAAAGGAAIAFSRPSSKSPAASPVGGVQIGAPTITIGR